MRIQTHRNQSRSRHFDLIGGGVRPWSIDLVSVAASRILLVGHLARSARPQLKLAAQAAKAQQLRGFRPHRALCSKSIRF
jgi:hypothetical protein